MATWTFFDSFVKGQFDGLLTSTPVDFSAAGDTLKIALVTSTLAPNVDTHDFWSDLNTNEVTGTNYTAGGIALTTKTLTESGGIVKFDADNVTWAQSGAGFSNARYAILYKDTSVATTSPLICFIDFLTDQGNTVSAFTVTMDATNGIFRVTKA